MSNTYSCGNGQLNFLGCGMLLPNCKPKSPEFYCPRCAYVRSPSWPHNLHSDETTAFLINTRVCSSCGLFGPAVSDPCAVCLRGTSNQSGGGVSASQRSAYMQNLARATPAPAQAPRAPVTPPPASSAQPITSSPIVQPGTTSITVCFTCHDLGASKIAQMAALGSTDLKVDYTMTVKDVKRHLVAQVASAFERTFGYALDGRFAELRFKKNGSFMDQDLNSPIGLVLEKCVRQGLYPNALESGPTRKWTKGRGVHLELMINQHAHQEARDEVAVINDGPRKKSKTKASGRGSSPPGAIRARPYTSELKASAASLPAPGSTAAMLNARALLAKSSVNMSSMRPRRPNASVPAQPLGPQLKFGPFISYFRFDATPVNSLTIPLLYASDINIRVCEDELVVGNKDKGTFRRVWPAEHHGSDVDQGVVKRYDISKLKDSELIQDHERFQLEQLSYDVLSDRIALDCLGRFQAKAREAEVNVADLSWTDSMLIAHFADGEVDRDALLGDVANSAITSDSLFCPRSSLCPDMPTPKMCYLLERRVKNTQRIKYKASKGAAVPRAELPALLWDTAAAFEHFAFVDLGMAAIVDMQFLTDKTYGNVTQYRGFDTQISTIHGELGIGDHGRDVVLEAIKLHQCSTLCLALKLESREEMLQAAEVAILALEHEEEQERNAYGNPPPGSDSDYNPDV